VVRIPETTPNGIDSSARLGSNVRIDGPVRIGAAATIADGVSIVGPTIIGDRVRVDRAAALERSILWNGSTIGARANLRDTVVGTGYEVAPESVLDDALVALEGSS
jgi:NDP-sugar pyrophosphorylase family protein